MLDVKKLLEDVFDPQEGEKVTVMVDLPHGAVAENDGWQARRGMAERWRGALIELAAERGRAARDEGKAVRLRLAIVRARRDSAEQQGEGECLHVRSLQKSGRSR